jgi:two-component system, NtrC family, C4-dicarboxylate transport sensor histidine kinase DctB
MIRGSGRFGWILAAAAVLLLATAIVSLRWAKAHADDGTDREAGRTAATQAGLFASELQKFRLLPLVLGEYPDVTDVLATHDPATTARLNGKLELLAARTYAAAIYLIDRNGLTVAASNWHTPMSFVGQQYGFRPYFRNALARGTAEMFALGTISGRPGLFIARRIEAAGKPLGVIVAKVEFNRMEADWARQTGISAIVDQHGVVIVTSRRDWQFRAVKPLDAETIATVRRTVQFGTLPLTPLPFAGKGLIPGQTVGIDGESYRLATHPVALQGANVYHFEPLAPAEAAAYGTARSLILAAFILIAAALIFLFRARERARLQAESHQKLEAQVTDRTRALREAHDRLIEESRERAAADLRYRQSREELTQANRLGSIGQITAGVAHEINQPVAAIRTFAENAGQFLARGKHDKAHENLGVIVGLTERIGSITAELRAFARRGTPAIESVPIRPVVDATLLLMGDRLRAAGVRFERVGDDPGLTVIADRMRLEQIFINILQNAVDALAGCDDPHIAFTVESNSHVHVTIADNGPGIAPELSDRLFTPFVTGKRDGLGLGLGIARDIAREFGGELDLVPSPLGGAAFRITLRHA